MQFNPWLSDWKIEVDFIFKIPESEWGYIMDM